MINQDKNTSFRFLDELTNSGLFNTEEQVIENYDVLVDYVRDWLESNEYDTAMACFELLLEKKNGKLRGDGKSPSALHEISQAIYTISLIEDGVGLADPESVIALNFLHDLGEEYGVKAPKLMEQFKKFNCSIGGQRLTILLRDFDLITKQYKGEPPKYKSEWEYYLPMQQSENVSVAKLIDRLHNIATIVGVKDSLRCREYITNTTVIVNDFVKHAVEKFPLQTVAYESLKQMIDTVCQINRYYLAQDEIGKPLPLASQIMADEMPELGFKVPKGLNPIFLAARRCSERMPKAVIASDTRNKPAPY